MRITILSGSPNRKGSTNILAEEFKRGADIRRRHTDLEKACKENISKSFFYKQR